MEALLNKAQVDHLPIGDAEKKIIKNAIRQYRIAGIDVELLDENTVKITQKRNLNGFILNNKELHDRARKIFSGTGWKPNIIPVVFSLDTENINIQWIKDRMTEFGIKRKDLISQLALDKSTLSLIFSESRGLTNQTKAAFYYYFLTYELNRDLRSQLSTAKPIELIADGSQLE